MAGFRGRKSPRKETLSLGTSKIFENFDNSLELRSTKFPGHHFVSFAVDVSTFYHRLKRHFRTVQNVITQTFDTSLLKRSKRHLYDVFVVNCAKKFVILASCFGGSFYCQKSGRS